MLRISLDDAGRAAALGLIDKHGVPFPNLIIDFAAAAGWFENLAGQEFWVNPGFLICGPAGGLRAQQIGAVAADLIDKFIARDSPAG